MARDITYIGTHIECTWAGDAPTLARAPVLRSWLTIKRRSGLCRTTIRVKSTAVERITQPPTVARGCRRAVGASARTGKPIVTVGLTIILRSKVSSRTRRTSPTGPLVQTDIVKRVRIAAAIAVVLTF